MHGTRYILQWVPGFQNIHAPENGPHPPNAMNDKKNRQKKDIQYRDPNRGTDIRIWVNMNKPY